MKFFKTYKIFTLISLIILLTLIVVGSGLAGEKVEQEEVKEVIVQIPTVAAGIPFLWMQENNILNDYGIKLEVKISPDHQRGLTLISNNDIDLLITGSNVGAKAYNKGIELKLLNINTWGIDYLLTNEFKAESWADLKGKSLLLPLKGGPLDFLVRYLLRENEISPDDVDLKYSPLPGSNKLFMAGKADAIVIPEPLVTINLLNNDNANLSFDIQKEWGKVQQGDNRIPFVGLFAAAQFINDNPEYTQIINGFYLLGVKWVNQHPEEAAKLANEYFGTPTQVFQKSLERVNLNYFSKTETKKLAQNYFKEIKNMYPEMIGGKLPDEEFYY